METECAAAGRKARRTQAKRANDNNRIDEIKFPSKVLLADDRQLDQAVIGPVWLKDPRLAASIVDALHYGETELKLYELSAHVVMANHIHVLLWPLHGLARITKAIKTAIVS